jgi:CheY-like chemotaxis protein
MSNDRYKRQSTQEIIVPDNDEIRILIAEDNLTVQKFLSNVLKRHLSPCKLSYTEKCIDCLPKFDKNEYDLILMDTTLEIDISECTSTIRAVTQIPLILLALSEMTIPFETLVGMGADGIVYKPIKVSSILKEITEVISINLEDRGTTSAFRKAIRLENDDK